MKPPVRLGIDSEGRQWWRINCEGCDAACVEAPWEMEGPYLCRNCRPTANRTPKEETTMALWIGLSRNTPAELLATDASGALTRDSATASAERWDQLALERVRAAFPDAEVELIEGNGITAFKALADDGGDDEDAIERIDGILSRLWEEGAFWVTAAPDRSRDAEGNAICARCTIRLLRVEDATGQLCHNCRKEA